MSVDLDSDAYDEYFDSLTGSDRNRALKPAARPPTKRPPKLTVQPKQRWFIQVVGYGIQVTGAVIQGVGELLAAIGKLLVEWGRSMTV